MNPALRFVTALFCCLLAFGANNFTGSAQSASPGNSDKILGQWSTFADMPATLINHASAFAGGKIYVFGGTSGTNTSTTTYVYTIATNSWSTTTDLPEPKNFPCAEAVGGKIYIFGGYASLSPFALSPSVLEFDPATGSFNTRADMPTPVAAGTSFVVGGKIYIVGGVNAAWAATSAVDLVQIYDPAADSWTTGTSIPIQARNMAAAALGTTVIVAGGYGPGTPLSKPNVYRGEVNGATIAWTKVADYPAGGIHRVLSGASADKLFFTGGQTATAVVANTYNYNLSTNGWESLQDKPSAVHSAGKLVFDGSGLLFALGGQLRTGQTAVTEAIMTQTVPFMRVNPLKITATLQTGKNWKYALQISNPGTGPLTWNASVTPPSTMWVMLGASSGTTQVDNTTGLEVRLDASTLTAGDYSAAIHLTSNDPDPSRASIDVPISLHVQVEPVTEKVVLLEEATGTWCGWCPYGVDSIHAIMARDQGRVVVVSYHNGDALSTPMETDIEKFLSITYVPGGNVNRVLFPGETTVHIGRDVWGARIDSILAVDRSPVSIEIKNKKFNPLTKQMSLTVSVKAIQAMNAPLRMNLIQTESGLNYEQHIYNQPYTVIYPFYHEHVVRLVVPSVTGTVIAATGQMAAGATFDQDYSFVSQDSLPEKSHFVVIVHKSNGTTVGEVLQAYEEDMMDNTTAIPDLPIPGEVALSQNYPNPFNPSTIIRYDLPKASHVTLKVFNSLGEEVAVLVNNLVEPGSHSVAWKAQGMSSGVYFYRLEAAGTTLTRKMTFLK